MWSNYQLVDPGDGIKYFTHMVPVDPLGVFRVDPGDQVHQSALGFQVEPLPTLMYTTDLMWCDVASQFTSALQEGKSLSTAVAAGAKVVTAPVDAGSTRLGVVPEDNLTSVSKATAKCKVFNEKPHGSNR